jgi:hypothetical protein
MESDAYIAAKRDALVRAIARRLHDDLRYQFIALEDGQVYNHCLTAVDKLFEGLVMDATIKSSGAFDGDYMIEYGMGIK